MQRSLLRVLLDEVEAIAAEDAIHLPADWQVEVSPPSGAWCGAETAM